MNIFLGLMSLLFLAERLGKYASIHAFFQQSNRQAVNSPPATVSILQPILSGDPTLWDCLAGNLAMKTDYEVEFLWLVDEEDGAGKLGCQKLIAESQKNVRLILTPAPSDGISPKTFKLIEGLKLAKGEMITVLDDDTILPDYGLEICISYLNQPEIGLAFGLPYYINFSNFWSSLVSCFVNGNSLMTYIPYTFFLSPFTINGMFYVIKRNLLEQVGGFSGLETAICDDYAIAQRFRSHGYQLAQTPLLHGISTQVETASQYFNLINRWFIFPQASIMKSATIRELMTFYSLVFLPNCFPLLSLIYFMLFPSIFTGIFCALYLGLSAYITLQINEHYLNKATPNDKILWILLIQIFLPFQILISLLSPRKINWRGHIMEITKTGEFKWIQRKVYDQIKEE